MYEALQTYLSRHGQRLEKKYEREGKPGCALPGAPSEMHKSRSEAWQAGQLQPVLLFSTNSVNSSEATRIILLIPLGLDRPHDFDTLVVP